MNHARLAAAALQFRLAMLQGTRDDRSDPARFDVEAAAACAVGCGDPDIDSAIRRLGTAWRRASPS